MFRGFRAWRKIVSRILSTKLLISLASGATPASATSWTFGYSTVSMFAHLRKISVMLNSLVQMVVRGQPCLISATLRSLCEAANDYTGYGFRRPTSSVV